MSALRTAVCHAERPRSSPARAAIVLPLDGRPAEAVYLETRGLRRAIERRRLRDDRDGTSTCPAGATRRPAPAIRARPRAGRRSGLRDEHRNERGSDCLRAPAGGDRSQRHFGSRRSFEPPVRPAEAVLLFDCASRSEWFGNPLASREIASIVSSFGDPTPALAGAYTRERSDGSAERKETGTIASSWCSAQLVNGRDELVRRFVEAARRAQIVTIVNLARSKLSWASTAEICEAFEAEIAFVVAARDGGAPRHVGAYGLTLDQRADLLVEERCLRVLTCEETQLHQGDLRIGVELFSCRSPGGRPASSESHVSTTGTLRRGKLRCSRR